MPSLSRRRSDLTGDSVASYVTSGRSDGAIIVSRGLREDECRTPLNNCSKITKRVSISYGAEMPHRPRVDRAGMKRRSGWKNEDLMRDGIRHNVGNRKAEIGESCNRIYSAHNINARLQPHYFADEPSSVYLVDLLSFGSLHSSLFISVHTCTGPPRFMAILMNLHYST